YDGAAAMMDVDQWVQSQGKTLMFIYGSNDPWSHAAFNLGDAVDSYKFIVAGGNHGSQIVDLAASDKSSALSILGRWAGKTMAKVPDVAREEQPLPRRR